MRLWFTASELATLAAEGRLPGLPATRRGVAALAAREGWETQDGLARRRTGRAGGGGTEYHLDLLPMPARLTYAKAHLTITPEDVRPALSDDGLSERARRARDARLVLLSLADRFRRDNRLSVAAADHLVAGLYATAALDVPAWVTSEVATLSARTLARWRERRGKAAPVGHDPAVSRKGTGVLDRAAGGAVRTYVLAAIAKQPFLSAKHVRAMIADRFGSDVAVPPLRTVQHALAAWRAAYRQELQALTDPDGWRSATEFALVNASRADRLNECWQIDASPADVMLTGGRHAVYVAIDVYSRRVVVLATPTPRADAVGLLIRKAVLAWGAPERVKTDNGSDFTATATQRLMAALGIAVELSPPYQPKAKGIVERAIGTFQRDLAVLPGFVGHSVADRKVIENRRSFAHRLGTETAELFGVDMDLPAFQAWCDDWAETIYGSTPHEGLGRRTPFQAAAAYAGPVRRIERIAALDVLLAPVPGKDGLRTVTKTGIRIGGSHYLTGTVMPGETVLCRHDPADLGRILLFAADGARFLGDAVCPELAGLDPVATIQSVKSAQKAHLAGRLKDIRKEMRGIGPREAADALRRQGERRSGTLVAFPRPTQVHDTDALAAAADAAAPAPASPLGGRAAALHGAMLKVADPRDNAVTRLPETREQRFRRALDIEARRAAGQPVRDEDLLWLGGYREGSEYRAMRALVDEFGAEAMRLA